MKLFDQISNYLEQHALKCYYKSTLGIDCPGCGFQRSLISLLRGDLSGSFHHYPALIPLMFMFFILVLHVIFKFRYGAKVLLALFILNTLIISVNYIIKLVPYFSITAR